MAPDQHARGAHDLEQKERGAPEAPDRVQEDAPEIGERIQCLFHRVRSSRYASAGYW